jgi:hypothetical protein
MKFLLEQNTEGNLLARQQGQTLLKYIIGIPLLVWGLLMLYGVFSSFIITMQMQGLAGIGDALLGSFVMLVFTAFVLPLGWWLVLSRSGIKIDVANGDIIQVSDWRIGRKEKRASAKVFRAVRVAQEPLDSSSTANHQGNVTYCQQIRLLARQPDKQASIEIGSLEVNERAAAIDMGQRVADALKLKLEVATEGEILFSPARETASSFDIKDEDD